MANSPYVLLEKLLMPRSIMTNLINHLTEFTGLSEQSIRQELAKRGGQPPISKSKLLSWKTESCPLPEWVEQVAIEWIIELWHEERDQCSAKNLFSVDKKYSQALGVFTVAEIIAILKKFKQAQKSTDQQENRD
jgi:hypothetical protein